MFAAEDRVRCKQEVSLGDVFSSVQLFKAPRQHFFVARVAHVHTVATAPPPVPAVRTVDFIVAVTSEQLHCLWSHLEYNNLLTADTNLRIINAN